MARFTKKRDLVDEASVLTVVAAIRIGELDQVHSEKSQYVLEAIRRSTNSLGDNASVEEIAGYVQGFDDSQLPGFINNVKGITFEIAYVEQENNDGDSVRAELFDDTNHPVTDVRLIDEKTGEITEIQLKATDSASYVRQTMTEHPDVPVVVTGEIAQEVPGSINSGIQNETLQNQIDDTLDDFGNSRLTEAAPLAAGALAAGIRAIPVVREVVAGRMNRNQAGKALLRHCAPSALKTAGLAIAFNSPLAPVAGAYLLYRIASRGVDVVTSNLKPVGQTDPCFEK